MRKLAAESFMATDLGNGIKASAVLANQTENLSKGWFYIDGDKGQAHNIFIKTATNIKVLLEGVEKSPLDLYITDEAGNILEISSQTFSTKINRHIPQAGNYKIVVINRGNEGVRYSLRINSY